MNSINFIGGDNKRYFKRNYVDVLELLTPATYKENDISLFGYEVSIFDRIIKSHINLAENFNSIFNVSGTTNGSSFASLSGASEYFIKQNGLSIISPFDFESKILYPSDKSLKNYESSSAFSDFLDDTLLPSIRLNSPTEYFGFSSLSESHDYLIDSLSWIYLLNIGNQAGLVYQPSSIIKDLLITKTYSGQTINLTDCMKAVNEFIWRNYSTCSLFQSLELIPTPFLSSTGKYTSGTQQLDKLNTLIEILYSPLASDNKDTRIKDAFDLYQQTGQHTLGLEKAGAFYKFQKATAWGMYDVNNQIDSLNLLYDINRCPDEFLPVLAYTIGWDLIGNNPKKWRHQLKNAVEIYKSVGTKRSLNKALGTVFGDINFDLSASIEELYESYVPNLLYYCITTDSPLVSSFDSWTPQLAQNLGVKNYTTKSMDINIRYIVDSILENAVRLFPDHFFVGPSLRFNLDDPDFVFSYRDVEDNKIPPWELEKYYRYCKISDPLLNYLEERLLCLGVSQSTVESTIQFIRINTIENVTNIGLKSNFLFFTLTPQYPPNYTYILSNFDKQKTKILPIWNGKSSTFNLSLDASSFEFDKFSFLVGSTEGLKSILKAVSNFSPAHSIPDIDLTLSDEDLMGYEESINQAIDFPLADLFTASTVMAGFNYIGLQMSSLGRIFHRDAVSNLSASVFSTGSSFSNLKRNTLRRRNHRHLLPKEGWFNRTGFDMPTHYVVDKNTIKYSTRGECDQIIGLIHRKLQERAYADASASLEDSSFAYNFSTSAEYSDIALSLANASGGPNSPDDYYNFDFGRGIHKLYLAYDKLFGFHTLTKNSDRIEGGFNIFAHTFGTALFNGNFDTDGSALTPYPNLVTSAFDDEIKLSIGDGSGVFSPVGGPSGTYIASTATSYYLNKPEFRNANIISGVELIMPSGTNSNSYFVIYDIDSASQREDTENYAIDNRLIKLLIDQSPGLPRIRFNLSAYGDSVNKLIPEHEFKLQIPFFIGRTNGQSIGGGAVKVWIHTDVDKGYIWSWTPNQRWVIHAASALTSLNGLNTIRNDLTHSISYDQIFPSATGLSCWYAQQNNQVGTFSLANITSDLFKTGEITFNTNNPPICIPNYYYSNGTQVHRVNQNYIIDIFADSDPETYLLLDSVNLVDMTLNSYASDYTEEEVQDIFNYFKSVALSTASRVAATTSGTFEASGGSRVEGRYHPKFGTYTTTTSGQYTEIDISR